MFMKLLYNHPWRIIPTLLIQLDATKKKSIPGKLLFVFYSCVSHLFRSGTLLTCTASINTALLLSPYPDDFFWQGNPFAMALGTPLLCLRFSL